MRDKDGLCANPVVGHCAKSKAEDESLCESCHSGFYMNDGNCLECTIENCVQCGDASSCSKCDSGFILYNGNSCIECSEHAKY